MARSGSDPLADAPTVEKSPAKAHSGSPRLIGTEWKHRNGVPIKRNQRLYLELPVFVYSLAAAEEPEPLLEVARSLIVYAGGGVLSLGATVKLGQELLLVNPRSEVPVACRVAAFEPKKNGCPPMVRLEFTQPVPRFWGVVFPPEDGDPAERKLPRVPRRSHRMESFQPIQVHRADEPANDVRDVCITQNISRDGLYFKSGELHYREGMRLTISFLRDSNLFVPNASCTGQIVRVDQIEDGSVGVAVRLVSNVKPSATPVSPQWQTLIQSIGDGLIVVSVHLCRSFRGARLRISRLPIPHLARIRQLGAKQANALVGLGTTVGKLCKHSIGEWSESAGELVRASCSVALAISFGTRVQFVKLWPEVRGHSEKYFRNLAALAKSVELWRFVPRRQFPFKGIAKQLLLAVAPIRTALMLPKDNGLHDL